MAKSKFIKELVNEDITLIVALKRLKVLASCINNAQLIDWVNNELNGYSSSAIIPEYRKFINLEFMYSGFNGSYKITNNPLPANYFSSKTLEQIKEVDIKDNIFSITNYTKESVHTIGVDYTILASEIAKNTGIICTNITQIIPQSYFNSILSFVEQKIIDVLIELENTYGILDDLDIDTSKKTDTEVNLVNNAIVNIIYDNSVGVEIGDSNTITKSVFGKKGGLLEGFKNRQ